MRKHRREQCGIKRRVPEPLIYVEAPEIYLLDEGTVRLEKPPAVAAAQAALARAMGEETEADAAYNAKVADFGLVKLLGGDAEGPATRTGIAMGTPGFMAPEQLEDAKSADTRADVYALGAVIYSMAARAAML